MAFNPMLPPWAQTDDSGAPVPTGPETPPWAMTGPSGPPMPPQGMPGPTLEPRSTPGVAPELAGGPGAVPPPPALAPNGQLADPFAAPRPALVAPWSEKEMKGAKARVANADAKAAAAAPAAGAARPDPMGEIRQGQEALIMDKGRIEADAADKRARTLTDAAYKGDDEAAAERARVEEGLAARRDAVDRFTAAAGKVAEMKEDPDRWWNSRDTGQKVASYAGAVISGILNPGGRNGMVELAERAIDRDLAAQRTDMANKRFGVEAQKTALGEMTQIFGDERAAYSYLRSQQKEQLAMQIEAEGAKSQSELIRNNAMTGALAVRESAAKDEQESMRYMEERAYRQKMDAEKLKIDRSQVAQGWSRISEDKRQFNNTMAERAVDRNIAIGERALERGFQSQAADAKAQRAQAEQSGGEVPGILLVDKDGKSRPPAPVIRDKTLVKDFVNQKTETEAFLGDLAAFEKTYSKAGGKLFDSSDEGARMRTQRARLRDRYAKIMGKGAPSEGDLKAFDEILPEATGKWAAVSDGAGIGSALGALREGVTSDFNSTMRNYTDYGGGGLVYNPATREWRVPVAQEFGSTDATKEFGPGLGLVGGVPQIWRK